MTTLATHRITGVHPYADKFPMLPESELTELAESIRANGLRQPIVITDDGLILDGRNRYAACQQVGIEPETVVYEGDDLAEYVIDSNVTRRNMSTGARAMSTALVLLADGRRENGRWEYGEVRESFGQKDATGMAVAVSKCGVVLDYKPDLVEPVVNGEIALNAAYEDADRIRRSAESEKIRERELRKRQREEEQAEAERNAQIVADLTEAGQTHYLDMIDGGTMKPASAWAAYQEDTRKERQREAELDRGRRDTCTSIAEAVRKLSGPEYADIFLRDFYPHEHRFLAEGMRLTGERIDNAVAFLTTIRKAIQ